MDSEIENFSVVTVQAPNILVFLCFVAKILKYFVLGISY